MLCSPLVRGRAAARLASLCCGLLLSMGLLPQAHAQSATNGKSLYDTNPFGGKACGNSTCHKPQTGTSVSSTNGINKGANNKSLILSAIGNDTGGMLVYSGLTSAQAADIAYYLANLSLAGSSPAASATPSSLSFAATLVGSTSGAQTVTLSNPGTAPLTLSSFASNSTAFTVTAGTCVAGGAVAASGSCTVSVKFGPAAGTASGTLTFTHNASPATTTVALNGTGAAATAPAASVSPASLSFAATPLGTASAAQTVTLTNGGTGALALSSLASSNPAFTISGGTCATGGSVAAGSNCTVMLVFNPSQVGTSNGSLSFTHNANPNTSTVALSGTGSAVATPAVTLSATSLSFPSTTVYTASAAQTLTLTNSGTANLLLTAVASNSGLFNITGGSCAAGVSVAPGAGCSVMLTFNPTATGAASGVFTFSHNASTATSTVALSGTGAAVALPQAGVSPGSLSFAATVLGATSAGQTVTLSNTGTAPLSLSALATNSTVFTLAGGSCAVAGSVAAGGSCTVVLSFKPTVTGAASGTLTFSHNASPATSIVALSGTGSAAPAPAAATTPTTLTFSQVAGSTSSSQTVTVSNNGNAALLLGAISLAGAQSADFANAGGSCISGGSVAAGASCTVLVTFSPTTASLSAASLLIAHNATGSPSSVILNGSGTAQPQPVLALNKNALSFPGQSFGTPSAAQTVTISNAGQATLVLSSVGLVGSDSADYSLGGGCAAGTNIAIGASCALAVTFTPSGTTLGTRSASISIASNASANPSVALAGTATALPAPVASLTPMTLTFSQVAGSTSASQTVTLSNTGNSALALGAVSISGAQAGSFALGAGSTCASGISLVAGANCTLLINFAPTSASVSAASLSITHNAAGSPSTVALNGTGTPAPTPLIALNKNALVFAAQALTTASAPLTLTVSNPGQAALVLSALTLSGANAGDFALSGSGVCSAGQSLPVNASCTVQVTFMPTAAALGTRTANLSIGSNASGAAPIVALSGTATAAPAPALTLAPNAAQDFGSVTLGALAATRIVTISNTGTAQMTGLAATASGRDFSATGTCASTLAIGASCTVTLRFMPTVVGAASGSLSVASNAAGSPGTMALSGTGAPVPLPVLAWTVGAPAYVFGDTYVGLPSAEVTYTMVNNGPGAVTVNAIAFAGANAADFIVTSACTASVLGVGQSCDVLLRFAPADMGLRSARLSVQSSGTSPAAVELSGNGVSVAGAALSVSAPNIVVPALAGASVPLTLTNSGTSAVTISALNFDGGQFRLRYTACGSLPLVLPPSGTCQLDISLAPDATSAASDTLTVTTTPDTVSKKLSVSAVPVANNVGAGGCSLMDPAAARFDPLLLAMAALAFAVLGWRRRPHPSRS